MFQLKQDKAFVLFLIILAVLSFFPLGTPTSFQMDQARTKLFTVFPYEFGEWKGKDQVVDERTYEILETRNVLSRMFENQQGQKVHLLLVGSHKDRRVAHPPEVCYLSSNYFISNELDRTLKYQNNEIPIKGFLAKSEKDPKYQENVFYVYKVGNRFTTNYYAQQLQFAVDRLIKANSQVLLIRVAGAEPKALEALLSEIIPFFT